MTRSLFSALLIAFYPAILSAQSIDIAGVTPAMDPSAIAHGILVSNIPRQAQRQQAGKQAVRPASPPRAAPVVSGYTPSAEISAGVDRQLVAQAAKSGPEAEKEMRDLLASGHARSEYRRVMAGLGLSSTDAVDALAFYLVAQWGVATDYREMVTPRQIAGVRAQVKATYPKIAARLATDGQRQMFAETLAIRATIGAGIHEAAVAAGNAARIEALSATARDGIGPMLGADPARFQLTDAGLTARTG